MNNTNSNLNLKSLNIMLTSPNNRNVQNITEESVNLPNLKAFNNQTIKSSFFKTTQNNNCKISEMPLITDYYSKDNDKNYITPREKDIRMF